MKSILSILQMHTIDINDMVNLGFGMSFFVTFIIPYCG